MSRIVVMDEGDLQNVEAFQRVKFLHFLDELDISKGLDEVDMEEVQATVEDVIASYPKLSELTEDEEEHLRELHGLFLEFWDWKVCDGTPTQPHICKCTTG